MSLHPNRLYYTVKLSSSLLKEYKYNLSLTFEECQKANLIISLSDSQMLSSIRSITEQEIDLEQLESWYQERDNLKKSKNNTKSKRKRIKELQQKINTMMYIPQYITVLMESLKDYDYMFKHGFVFNGKLYKRMSCSASQARVSTIVFVTEDIKDELKRRLDNGRDFAHPLAASKYNAYLGLYSSASKVVTRPRYCIIPDYCENIDITVNYSIETDWDIDDIIEPRTLTNEFNRMDGSGLISPQMAEQWGKDLDEDYTPCQFCIRYAFTKGLVNEFDFVEWCRDENDGNYIITDIYGKKRDLREIDVILTEGMAKLWDSWDSQESYESNCLSNGIDFRITKYSPKEDKQLGLMNYQYLQTLELKEEDIQNICKDTIDYIQGVSYDDKKYAMLFMLGENMTSIDINKFLQSSDNYWLKSLILEDNLFNDKYTKEKIRDMIVRKIELACLGRLYVHGNYQAIVPDSYSLMEHMVGKPVQGLLKDGEFYSQFWAKQGVNKIACARSPMTWRGEWAVMDIPGVNVDVDSIEDEEEKKRISKINKYYKYSYSGIITNTHGIYTLTFAGSDFDFDILFTTNNKSVLKSVYKNELVTAYDVPKPKKKPNLTEEDLYLSDTFSFGQQIGPLTNICTSIYALLPLFEEGSKEYNQLIERIKQCCVNQSKQIDKTKIGQAVKCIPKVWNVFQRIQDTDTVDEIESKNFYNRILADRKPYFFRYKYKQLAKEYNDFVNDRSEYAHANFGKTINELLEIEKNAPETLNERETYFLAGYHKHLPVIDSDCVMNQICKYIENTDFHIKQKVRSVSDFDYKVLTSDGFNPNGINIKNYSKIKEEVANTFKCWEEITKANKMSKVEKSLSGIAASLKFERETECEILKNRLLEIISNEQHLSDYLVYLFYVDKPSYSKSTLWLLTGRQIYNNIRSRKEYFEFPIKNEHGDLEFLYEKYQRTKLPVPKTEKELEEEAIEEFMEGAYDQ